MIRGGGTCKMRQCSTPCGITEGVTRGSHAALLQLLMVLNALRHHGGRHAGIIWRDGRGSECSTPCGITEGVTSAINPTQRRDLQCSTPCGITEGVT